MDARRYAICLLALGAIQASSAALPKIRVDRGGQGFITDAGRPFVPMGVTYYRPNSGWAPQLWKQFDPAAVSADFHRMRALGVNCVRVFLSFGSFFERPDRVSEEGLRKFDQLLEIAERNGIYIHPTGPDHWEGLPKWAQGDRIGDDKILERLEFFWRQFAARYRGRPAIFAYDLRNEPEVPWDTAGMRKGWTRWLEQKYGTLEELSRRWNHAERPRRFSEILPPKPADRLMDCELMDYQRFREEIAERWTRGQTAAIKSVDPQALVSVGLIQWSAPVCLPRVAQYSAFRPERQAAYLDFLEFHFYPLADGAYQYRSDAERDRNLAYFECLLREMARAKKPVVVGEFGWYGGGPAPFVAGGGAYATQAQQADWCRRVIATSAGVACGWINWGLYDDPDAGDVSRLTGLLTASGAVKEWGRTFQKFAEQFRQSPPPPRAIGTRPALDWDRCLTNLKAERQFESEYDRAFEQNLHPPHGTHIPQGP